MEGPELEISEIYELERVAGDATARPARLAFSLLDRITDGFSEERMIGRGGYARVYKGVLPNGLRIAVKMFDPVPGSDDESDFEAEVLKMIRVAHKNIVRLIGYCRRTQFEFIEYSGKNIFGERRERLICTEYLPNGTLEDRVADKFHGGLDWSKHYQILKGICHGLHHLHDEVHIFHGDIKPDNILLDENLVPKIFDFGLSMFFDEGESSGSSEKLSGTIGYMAPEMVNEGRWSTKSDIFSFGATILDLLVGRKNRSDWYELSVEQVLKILRKRLVKHGAFSSWENNYQQVRTCLEIGYNCVDKDPFKRPTALEIIQLLDETECTNDSGSSGHAPLLWQLGDEESDLSNTDTIEQGPAIEQEQEPEPESTAESPPSDDDGETNAQEHDKPETVRTLPASADLSKLKFLEEITDDFSHKRIVGKDGTHTEGSHKAFVYKGDAPRRKMVAVKRFIGVAIAADKFRMEAEQFKSLDHKNIVKVLSHCHDESRKQRLVQFKGLEHPIVFYGPEQLLCYEYMHNGSLREYLMGQGSRELDWHMRYRLIKGTCKGLRYLHKDRGAGAIVHLNLSPSNVLLGENNTPCITGFDFSKLIGEKESRSISVKKGGQTSYLPRDFFYSRGTNLKYLATVDIYSLALMILEITTRQEIIDNHVMLIKSIEEKWREESQIKSLYPSLEPEKLWQVKLCIDIGLDCVKSKHGKRPTAGKIMSWLEGKKSVPVPRTGAGGVTTPPVRTNINRSSR